jgi:hypothetical protein
MYLEYYFNSEIFTDLVKGGGNRNRRILELNEPLNLQAFQVKSIELPLSWDNITETHTFNVSIRYVSDNAVFSKTFLLPSGLYTADTFTNELQTLLRDSPWNPYIAPNPPDQDKFQVVIDEANGRLAFGFLPSGHTGGRTGEVWLTVDFPESMRKYVSVPYYDTWSSLYTDVADSTADVLEATTDFALRLVPNYLYLHSNLMTHTQHGSATRAVGAYTSRTIMAKIPIDSTGFTWGVDIMLWDNPSLDKDFMFRCAANQHITRMEFWFTDEAGKEIDFNNVSFSLTLSCLA